MSAPNEVGVDLAVAGAERTVITLPVTFPLDLPALQRAIERDLIGAALTAGQGNRSRAARLLGIQRTCLVEKIKKHARRGVFFENIPAIEPSREAGSDAALSTQAEGLPIHQG